MNINSLYEKTVQRDKISEEQLYRYLTVSFRMFILRRNINKLDAEEIVQNTLAIIAQRIGEIEIEISFAKWAYTILKNQMMSYFKSKKLPKNQNVMLKDDFSSSNSELDMMLKDQLYKCLKKINNVHKTHARIINLHFLGFSTKEICIKLHLTSSNFYTSLYRARAMLKICLEKGDVK